METTREILTKLHANLVEQYRAELERMPMKKSVRDTLIDGFADGARSGIHHTVEMLGVKVLGE